MKPITLKRGDVVRLGYGSRYPEPRPVCTVVAAYPDNQLARGRIEVICGEEDVALGILPLHGIGIPVYWIADKRTNGVWAPLRPGDVKTPSGSRKPRKSNPTRKGYAPNGMSWAEIEAGYKRDAERTQTRGSDDGGY